MITMPVKSPPTTPMARAGIFTAPGDVSQFQALTTALASTIGTGNIIGVGTAIFLGGPGAVFWCWITGVFGAQAVSLDKGAGFL